MQKYSKSTHSHEIYNCNSNNKTANVDRMEETEVEENLV